MLTVQQMRTLPDFNDIPDPRKAEGKRHRLSVGAGIAAGATLCGMRGYKAIAAWANISGFWVAFTFNRNKKFYFIFW